MSAARKDKPNPFGAAVKSRSARAAAEEPKPPRGATAKKTDPVRITIDLDPIDYRTMKRAVLDLGELADNPTATHSAMWRALLAEVSQDQELAARVAQRMRKPNQ